MELFIPKVKDFEITGDGTHAAWDIADWQKLTRTGDGTLLYETRAKTLYSETGMYFLVDCEDKRLTCSFTEDQLDLWTEDVVEIFLWPDEAHPVYFEYEISPLNHELVLMVNNNHGTYRGWLPWHYTGADRVQRATTVRGGDKVSMAEVAGWTCECHIPFSLLTGLGNMPPASGTLWRGNIYRMDHDRSPEISHWEWCPDTRSEFHNIYGFGTFRFE